VARADHAIASQFGDSQFVTALLCDLGCLGLRGIGHLLPPRGGEARGKAVVAQSDGHKAALAAANVRAPRIRRSVRAGDIYVMELELRIGSGAGTKRQLPIIRPRPIRKEIRSERILLRPEPERESP
jgi:hypothetical protein